MNAGAVVVLGHPANGVTATKQADGRWTVNTEPHRVADPEDVARLGRLIYAPGAES